MVWPQSQWPTQIASSPRETAGARRIDLRHVGTAAVADQFFRPLGLEFFQRLCHALGLRTAILCLSHCLSLHPELPIKARGSPPIARLSNAPTLWHTGDAHRIRDYPALPDPAMLRSTACSLLLCATLASATTTVSQFQPQGTVGDRGASRALHFSTPMVRLGNSDGPEPFDIDCAGIAGEGRWVNGAGTGPGSWPGHCSRAGVAFWPEIRVDRSQWRKHQRQGALPVHRVPPHGRGGCNRRRAPGIRTRPSSSMAAARSMKPA